MAGKVAIRKAKLREALIQAAEDQIAKGGLAHLKARGLAQAAGCSLGAIYTLFDDLDALAMTVNGRTFRRLGSAVSAAVEKSAEDDPTARLITMAHGYLHFAAKHKHLWRALFDLQVSDKGPVPPWYVEELDDVLALMAEPLARLFPDMALSERDLMGRSVFSAVHGIVVLGLEERLSAVPPDQLERMLSEVIGRIAAT